MDHTDVGLRAVIKALTDVVAPALDRSDPLAQEQLKLSVQYLEFLRSRIDFLHGRARFELGHHLAMADKLIVLARAADDPSAKTLAMSTHAGRETMARPGATTSSLNAAQADVAAAIAALVRRAPSLDEPLRTQINRSVLESTGERIEFERAWYVPLGFDPLPAEAKTVAALLDEAT